MVKNTSGILDKKTVKHIAKLANLKLSSPEITKFSRQLTEVLGYIKILNKLNTKKQKTIFQAIELKNIWRQDKVGKSLSQKQALSGKKNNYKGYFKIKAIFD